MLKYLVAACLLAAPAFAEEFNIPAIPGNGKFNFDLGLGAQYEPIYPGSDDQHTIPWLVLKNAGFGEPGQAQLDGFVVLPSFGYTGARDAGDDPHLDGLDDITAAYEVGGRVNFGYGPLTSYVTARQSFGGQHGIVGEVGFRYRTDLNDRLTMWSGIEMLYGNAEYNDTYFGVSDSEAVTSGYDAYDVGSGFTTASAKFSMRYSLNDITSIIGEAEFGRLIGDAADSPLVRDRDQPVLRLGITRNISLNF